MHGVAFFCRGLENSEEAHFFFLISWDGFPCVQRAACSVPARALPSFSLRPAFRPKLTPVIEVQEVRHTSSYPCIPFDTGLHLDLDWCPSKTPWISGIPISKRNHRSLHETILFSDGQSQTFSSFLTIAPAPRQSWTLKSSPSNGPNGQTNTETYPSLRTNY